MKPSDAFARHRDTIRRVVAANRAGNPRVFGSMLQESLGVRVDLLTPADLHPKFRRHVLDEAVPV